MGRRKLLITLAILVPLGAVGGVRVWQAYQKKNASAQAASGRGRGAGAKVVTVSVGTVEIAPVREEMLITGSLKPKEQVDVMAKATGRVQKLFLQVGDFVRKGDLVAVLEDDELQQQLKRATASLNVVRATMAQREAELANAEADLKRAETLLKEGLVARQEYEARRTSLQVVNAQLQLARAQADQARADINELKIQIEQRKIYAPMSSHAAQRFIDEGALVSPATPIVRLVNLGTMVTIANLPERGIAKLRPGAPAVVRVDAYGERTFSARVSRISPVLDAATRSALVEIEIPNPGVALRAEMFARVTLDLGTTRAARMIPREALVYRGQQPGIYLLDAKRPTFRSIETGLTQGDRVEVLTDLAPGTRIVTRGATMISEGDQIRIVGEGERGAREAGPPQKAENRVPRTANAAEQRR